MKYEEKKVLAVSVSLICVTIFIFIYASFVLNLDKMKFMYLLFFFFTSYWSALYLLQCYCLTCIMFDPVANVFPMGQEAMPVNVHL